MSIRFEKLPAVLEWKYGLVADCELRNGAWGIVRWRHASIPQPNEDQLLQDCAEYQKMLDDTAYQRLRAGEYPPIGDQLDVLWKAVIELSQKTATNLPKESSDLLDAIQAVKDKYPKPVQK